MLERTEQSASHKSLQLLVFLEKRVDKKSKPHSLLLKLHIGNPTVIGLPTNNGCSLSKSECGLDFFFMFLFFIVFVFHVFQCSFSGL